MNIPKILYAIILLCASVSCRKVTVQCKAGNTCYIVFHPPISMDTIPDTLAAVTPYQKGSNFSLEADSTFYSHFNNVNNMKVLPLPGSGASCGKYDWKIIFYPSGRQFLVKGITFYERAEKQAPEDTQTPCFNDYSYAINDSLCRVIAGNVGYDVKIDANY